MALREKHAFGEVVLRSSREGARVRVSPLERWQWKEVTRVESLPYTFRGPMGRYLVEVMDGERLSSRSEVVVNPSTSRQVALDPPGRKRSKVIPILGGLAAGGVVAVLAGGKSKENKPTTGGITIRLP